MKNRSRSRRRSCRRYGERSEPPHSPDPRPLFFDPVGMGVPPAKLHEKPESATPAILPPVRRAKRAAAQPRQLAPVFRPCLLRATRAFSRQSAHEARPHPSGMNGGGMRRDFANLQTRARHEDSPKGGDFRGWQGLRRTRGSPFSRESVLMSYDTNACATREASWSKVRISYNEASLMMLFTSAACMAWPARSAIT